MNRILLILAILSLTVPAFAAHHMPGKGVEVQPARATWNTGYFQEALVRGEKVTISDFGTLASLSAKPMLSYTLMCGYSA